jgi:NADH-ubiquinone oxidoreductase chain 3
MLYDYFCIFLYITEDLNYLFPCINILLSPHNPYKEKDSAFEYGFHPFLGQNRAQLSLIFAPLFLICYYIVSAYTNHIYSLIITLVFFFILILWLLYIFSSYNSIPEIPAFDL